MTRSFSVGKQVSLSQLDEYGFKNRALICKKLHEIGFLFFITFESISEYILECSLYEVVTAKQIKKCRYDMARSKPIFVAKAIAKMLWQQLFGEIHTPFECSLAFIKHDKKEKKESIVLTMPCMFENEPISVLTTGQTLLDLGTLTTHPHPCLTYSYATSAGVSLVKLTSKGKKIHLLTTAHGVCASMCTDGIFIFYICSGCLYVIWFDGKKKRWMNEKITEYNQNIAYASVRIGPNKTLLVTKDFKVFLYSYAQKEKNSRPLIVSESQLTPYYVTAVSASFSEQALCIVTTEKVRGYLQLISYDVDTLKRTVLTTSCYNKQDAVISPCGNYVAYVHISDMGKRYIEMMNIYTNVVKKVTEESGHYSNPTWLLQ